MDETDVLHLAARLRESSSTLVFTGAGISTGSGIPDFRGPKGLWTRWKPVYYQDFVASHRARVEHWEFKLAGWHGFRDARPNPGHLALVELERRGYVHLVVTQNIDGLHQAAGQSPERLIELHGTNLKIECIDCRRLTDPDPVYREFAETRDPPRCGSCGGFLKPATVSFGQHMPMDKLEKALSAARSAALVVSIGSTLEVEPAASVPMTAKRSGAFYVVMNLGETAHDGVADLRIEADAAKILPDVVAALQESPR
jgi:NAD-dependent deacetylase